MTYSFTARDMAEKARNSFDTFDQEMWSERARDAQGLSMPRRASKAEREATANPDEKDLDY